MKVDQPQLYSSGCGLGPTVPSSTTVPCRHRDPWRQHKSKLVAVPPAKTTTPYENRKDRRQAAARAKSLARDVKRQEKHLAQLKHQQASE